MTSFIICNGLVGCPWPYDVDLDNDFSFDQERQNMRKISLQHSLVWLGVEGTFQLQLRANAIRTKLVFSLDTLTQSLTCYLHGTPLART